MQALFTCFICELVKKVKEMVNMFVQPHPNFHGRNRSVHVMSKRWVKESKCLYGESVPNDTVPGAISRNKMDTHAETCCPGANWQLLDFTNKVCKVTPFLDSYEPVKEVIVARCGTVWMSPNTGHEYLLVGDKMLWFGSQMDHSLIN